MNNIGFPKNYFVHVRYRMSNRFKLSNHTKQFERDYNSYRSNRVLPLQPSIIDLMYKSSTGKQSSLLDRTLPPDAYNEDFSNRLENDNGSYKAITIAPRQQIGIDWDETKEITKRIMSRTANHYLLIPASDDNLKLHYHGIAIFTSPKLQKEFRELSLQYLGFPTVKVIKDTQGWYKYVFDEHQMQKQFDYADGTTWRDYVVRDYLNTIHPPEDSDDE